MWNIALTTIVSFDDDVGCSLTSSPFRKHFQWLLYSYKKSINRRSESLAHPQQSLWLVGYMAKERNLVRDKPSTGPTPMPCGIPEELMYPITIPCTLRECFLQCNCLSVIIQ
jgi:hypothetical protein